jgi:hypothetical protein
MRNAYFVLRTKIMVPVVILQHAVARATRRMPSLIRTLGKMGKWR